MRSRRGISLVELIVVMTGCAVLLSLSAAFLQRVMHAQMRSRVDADLQRTLLRLDQSVRNDIHTATAAEIDPAKLNEGAILRLELPDAAAIEYRRQESGLLRVQLARGEITSRETFSFPREIEPEITRPQPRLIVLAIRADDDLLVEVPAVHVRIEAALPQARGEKR
jgi:type II secretory pathway component PulJ